MTGGCLSGNSIASVGNAAKGSTFRQFVAPSPKPTFETKLTDGRTVRPRRCQQANSQGIAHESIRPANTSPIAQRLYFCTFGDGRKSPGKSDASAAGQLRIVTSKCCH